MSTRERLVVVGGDAGGMSAAAQARRLATSDRLEIVAFERGKHTSYSACGIPYLVAGDVSSVDDLVARTPAEFARQGIEVHLGHEVIAIDTARQRITVRATATVTAPATGERDEPYDHLVIATGATPVRPPLPGVSAEGIFGVQTLDDGATIVRYLESRRPTTAVVVGGGYIGLEMAEAMVRRGIDTTLIEAAPHVMATLDADMAALVRTALEGVGVAVRCNTTVSGFEADDGGAVRAVQLAAGATIAAEVVVLGIGVRPNVELARGAGIGIGSAGGISVDDHMRTSAPNVWAAGDCVESFHRVTRHPAVIALGTHANKQGRVAGINIAGGDARFEGVIGTAVSKICAYEVARTGVNEREATQAGIGVVSATTDSTTRAGYFPGAAPITVKMLAEVGTGRVVGAQIIGREGAAKRIDIVALAIWNEMTAVDLAGADLGYAPPFSPVWDPVLVAARRLSSLL